KNLNKQVSVAFNKFYLNVLPKENKEEYQYLNLLENVLLTGHLRETRNSQTYSKFGKTFEFDLSKGFTLLTTKKMLFRGIFEETMLFLSGKTDAKILSDKGVTIWNDNTSRNFLDNNNLAHYEEFDMGPLYPFQYKSYGLEYNGKNEIYVGGFDQIQYCINL